MTEYLIVYWKDIPTAVEAEDDDTTVRLPLSPRFQQLIDTVAMRQGLTSTDDYLAHWEKRPGGRRPGDPQSVVDAVAAELEEQFDEIRSRYT